MGLFGRGKGGGLMNVIRCDEQEYLVWKWRPEGQELRLQYLFTNKKMEVIKIS